MTIKKIICTDFVLMLVSPSFSTGSSTQSEKLFGCVYQRRSAEKPEEYDDGFAQRVPAFLHTSKSSLGIKARLFPMYGKPVADFDMLKL